MITRIEGKFGIQNTRFDAEFFEEKLELVASIGVVDKDETFAFD